LEPGTGNRELGTGDWDPNRKLETGNRTGNWGLGTANREQETKPGTWDCEPNKIRQKDKIRQAKTK
jgi:uncharacterized cupin superfamily protein